MGAATTTTGPNDTRCIIWALGEFFYLFSLCFFLYLMICIGAINSLKVQWGSTQATTMTMGPNNARRVIWALGECFSFSFISFILIVIYRYYNPKNL